jgi:hypothetical protein
MAKEIDDFDFTGTEPAPASKRLVRARDEVGAMQVSWSVELEIRRGCLDDFEFRPVFETTLRVGTDRIQRISGPE